MMSLWSKLKALFQSNSTGTATTEQFCPAATEKKIDKAYKTLIVSQFQGGVSTSDVVAELRGLGPAAAPTLLRWLEDPGTQWFNVAADLLGASGDLRAAPLLIQAIERTEPWPCSARGLNDRVNPKYSFRHACEALVKLQAREAIEPLRKAIHREPAHVIIALAKLKDVAFVPQILAFVNERDERCAAALFAICELTPEQACERISPRLAQPGFRMNDETARKLAKIAPDRAFALISAALRVPGHGLLCTAVLSELNPGAAFDSVVQAIRLQHNAAYASTLLQGVRRLDENRYRRELRSAYENNADPSKYTIDAILEGMLKESLTPEDTDVLFRVAERTASPTDLQIEAIVKTRDPRAPGQLERWFASRISADHGRTLLKGLVELNQPECVPVLIRFAQKYTTLSSHAHDGLLKLLPANIRKLSQADLESLSKFQAFTIRMQSSDSDWGTEVPVNCGRIHRMARDELERRES